MRDMFRSHGCDGTFYCFVVQDMKERKELRRVKKKENKPPQIGDPIIIEIGERVVIKPISKSIKPMSRKNIGRNIVMNPPTLDRKKYKAREREIGLRVIVSPSS